MPKAKDNKKYYHQKLVRDNIPAIIMANGDKCEIRIMSDKEYQWELRQKLIEEAKELRDAPPEETLKEMADVLECLKALAKSQGIDFAEIEIYRKNRQGERGGFKKKIFLEWSNKPAGK